MIPVVLGVGSFGADDYHMGWFTDDADLMWKWSEKDVIPNAGAKASATFHGPGLVVFRFVTYFGTSRAFFYDGGNDNQLKSDHMCMRDAHDCGTMAVNKVKCFVIVIFVALGLTKRVGGNWNHDFCKHVWAPVSNLTCALFS